MNKKIDALLKNFGTQKVSVIHNSVRESPKIVAFVTVANTLSTEDKLTKAFMLTNSIEDGWWNNKEITKMFDGDSCRSTMVGDMVLIGTEKFRCESSGWSKVS